MKVNPVPSFLVRFKPFRVTSLLLALGLAILAGAASTAQASSAGLVIAEVYGGGGNSGSYYQNDFICLFNRGNTPVDVTGWSVQYASSSGSSWQVTPLTAAVIPAGGYYLVQEAKGTGGTAPLPTPDATGTISMAGTSGKVALCNSTTTLSGGCPTGGSVVDFVGFGTANCYEGSGATPVLSNTTSAQRVNDGCTDTDDNALDFVTSTTQNPRNSASSAVVCPTSPVINNAPTSETRILGETATFTVMAGGATPLYYQWYHGATALTDDTRISGATATTVRIAELTMADGGDYTVVVTNSFGAATSTPPATLTISDPTPTFLSQPISQTALAGSTVAFRVAIYGAPPYSYRWQKGGVDVTEGGKYSGTTSSTLLISNVDGTTEGDYTCIATCHGGSTTSDPASLTISTSGILVRWDFNLANLDPSSPPPSYGDATATAEPVVTTNVFNPAGGSGTDPIASVLGATNRYWGSASYPAQGTGNKTTGVRFNVSTAGKRNIAISFSQRASSTASKYTRLQYTTNGTDYIDYPASMSFSGASTWENRAMSLDGFPGVRDNPNFGFQILAEFQNTATYGLSNNATYWGVTSGYNPSGTLSYDMVTVTADEITNASTPPSISAIADATVIDTAGFLDVPFTVSGGAGTLIASAATGNPVVISGASPSLAGTSGSVYLSLGGADGVSPVWVTVTDENGDSATAIFNVTVNPPNLPPTITQVPHTNTLVGTALTIPLTIGDDVSAATVNLSAQNDNPALIQSIQFTGSGTDRAVIITPVADAAGVGPIKLIATDQGGATNYTAFTVMVRPSTSVVLNDMFGYPDGYIVANSYDLWNSHSGTAGQMDVTSGVLNVTGGDSEDCNVRLIGEPYMTNSGLTLYSSFVVKCTGLPNEGGSYFAHFKDDGTGANSGFGARVWSSTTNAASGKFRLGIGNGDGATNTTAQFPLDLSMNTEYTVVTRFVLSSGTATIWINPDSEASASVTADDVSKRPADINNPINVTSYAFREANGEGGYTVDNLKVGLSFADVVPVTIPSPIALNASLMDGSVVLTWSNPAFSLASSPTVNGTFTKITGATSPYTNVPAGNLFFRLVWP